MGMAVLGGKVENESSHPAGMIGVRAEAVVGPVANEQNVHEDLDRCQLFPETIIQRGHKPSEKPARKLAAS